jgi:hypothetical protein
MQVQQKTVIKPNKGEDKDSDYSNNNDNPLFDRKVDLITAGLSEAYAT